MKGMLRDIWNLTLWNPWLIPVFVICVFMIAATVGLIIHWIIQFAHYVVWG